MRRLLVLVPLVACGPSTATPDAPTPAPDAAAPDAAGDAAIDAPPPPPPGCDYAELRDLTNDDVPPATGTPEDTGLTFAGHTTLCGSIASGHFDGDITVDVDGYVLTVAADADVVIRLTGLGLTGVDLAGVDVYGGPTFGTFIGTVAAAGDHGVAALHLTAGRYELDAFALAGAAIAAPVTYKIDVATDAPAGRCPALTVGGYAEAHDGAQSAGNDMVTFVSGAPPALTAATTDAPEPTGITLDTATPARLTGQAATALVPDTYQDRDTFALTTGAATTELAVRLTWPGAADDLDFFLLEAGLPTPVVRATTVGASPELRLFAVKPATAYWLVVAAKVGSTPLPVAYAATLCGGAAP